MNFDVVKQLVEYARSIEKDAGKGIENIWIYRQETLPDNKSNKDSEQQGRAKSPRIKKAGHDGRYHSFSLDSVQPRFLRGLIMAGERKNFFNHWSAPFKRFLPT